MLRILQARRFRGIVTSNLQLLVVRSHREHSGYGGRRSIWRLASDAVCAAGATLGIMILMTIATINPNIQGGVPCFTGTRVPVVA